MIANGHKTSILVPSQLPEFIRDNPEYENFVLFLQAYYEWMELPNTSNSLVTTATTQQGVTYGSKNLTDYHDIDETIDTFTSYFYNEFITYFPNEILADKNKVIKLAKQLYQAKGTPASFQFFFRTLYNSDVDFFFTKDAVLKASAGKWYISKSLKLSSSDLNFLVTNNLRAFGETTKSIATIENTVLAKGKIEVFISDIQRLFQSGETIRIVDSNNQNVYFKDSAIVSSNTVGATILRAKLVGQISQVRLTPIGTNPNRGSLYEGANTTINYPGDPVVFYGGLNDADGIGAEGNIGETTKGSLKRISIANSSGVLLGGFGYSEKSATLSNTTIIGITGGGGATAEVAGINTSTVFVGDSFFNPISTINFIPTDRIGSKTGGNPSIEEAQYLFDTTNGFILGSGVSLNLAFADATSYIGNVNVSYGFANLAMSNANTTLANSLSFVSPFNTYPISSVIVTNQGGGLTTAPTITAQSTYKTADTVSTGNLGSLGILGPIKIDTKGTGYGVGNVINIIGGSGYGAYANVTTVAANGAILNVAYVHSQTGYRYPLGGLGYRLDALPTLTVTSTAGINAVLSVAGIVGQGAAFTPELDRVGSITTVNISNFGEDYIAPPNVSFKVHDIVVTNIVPGNGPVKGDIIYQGANTTNSTYLATVDSLSLVLNDVNPTSSLYILRAFNFNSIPNIAQPILANNESYSLNISNSYASTITTQYAGINSQRYANGVITYGDGTATGIATFLNGLTLGAGQYLDSSGQPSSFDVLQSINYNNYTYQITLEKEIAKYRTALLNMLHPTGMKVIGRFAMKSNNDFDITISDALQTGNTLFHFTANANSAVTISSNGDFSQLSSNVISFSSLPWSGVANLANIFTQNTIISFVNQANDSFYGIVNTVNTVANTVTLKNNVWLSMINVARGSAVSGNNTINISNVYTSSYNLFNNGNYSSNNPIVDIIQVGDFIKLNNEVKLVTNVNYTGNNKILTLANNFTYSNTGNISVNKVFTTKAANVQIIKLTSAGYT
jgi:hypothetical protein